MNEAGKAIVTIITAIIAIAIIGVLVGKGSKTSQVIQSATSGFGNILAVALAPATGVGSGIGTPS